MAVTSLVPWYGADRMIARDIAALLQRCEWVGIPFAGGCGLIQHLSARTILANDLHRAVMNLAEVVRDAALCERLVAMVADKLFHPDELAAAQSTASASESETDCMTDDARVLWAAAYFVSAWMGRSETAGTSGELTGNLAIRWSASGGDSNRRYRSAVEALGTFHRAFVNRCTFTTTDAFAFLQRCIDAPAHGLYVDPPFIGAGQRYRHNAGKGQDEINWHGNLVSTLEGFRATRVVVRAHDIPEVRTLYSAERWRYVELTGRKQTNATAPELLMVRN